MVIKRIDDEDRVAVLVSHGWGAGWYTWHGIEDLIYDATVVDMVLADVRYEDIVSYCQKRYGQEHYYGGASGLAVHWLEPGTEFRIDEYDGAESLVLREELTWHTA